MQRITEKETAQVLREKTTIPDQTQLINLSRRQSYLKVAATKPTQIPNQPWTKVNDENWKKRVSVTVKIEQRGHKILFSCKNRG